MRKLLIILLTLNLSLPATITIPGTSNGHCSGGSCAAVNATFGTNSANNDIIVANVITSGTTTAVASVTDSLGDTFTQVTPRSTFLAGAGGCEIWWARTGTSGTAQTVTANLSPVASGVLHIMLLRSVTTSTPTDQHVSGIGTSTSPNSGNVTTTSVNEMLVGAIGSTVSSTTFSAGSGYTLQISDTNATTGAAFGFWTETQTVSATGTYSASGTLGTSAAWNACMATFIDSSQPAGGSRIRHSSGNSFKPFRFPDTIEELMGLDRFYDRRR